MCRFTVYKGYQISIGEVINEPENSLIYQSRQAHYHPGVEDVDHMRNILVNADGFGVAWYSTLVKSCCFRFVTPAWSNGNLKNIGEHIKSRLFFAHVRAATSGHDLNEKMIVSLENCHPFKFGVYTMMHNGAIAEFSKIKLNLLNLISERSLHVGINGTTDSEHIFALFLFYLPKVRRLHTHKRTLCLSIFSCLLFSSLL